MASFKSKELVFGLALDDDDPDEERVFLRLAGCKDETAKALVSCGRTQNKALTNTRCVKCKVKNGGFQVKGADGLRTLREALKEMLNQLEPVEERLRADEETKAAQKAAATKKAAVAHGQEAAKAPAKKATKPPAKKR